MDDPYAPSIPSLAGATRTAAASPLATTRSAARPLGSLRGNKSSTSYSPYARRTRQQPPQEAEQEQGEGDDEGEDDEMAAASSSPVQPRKGLFGVVGRALGSIFRSSSTRSISTSTSLKDLRQELHDMDHSSSTTTATTGNRVQKSRTSNNLAALAPPPRATRQQQQQLAASSSLSALSALSSSHAPPQQPRHTSRSAHATLILPSSSRAASPALSSTSTYVGRHVNRSPSPTRNHLAQGMSSFNLAGQLASATSATGNPFTAATATGYGLQSRSPFTTRDGRSPSIPRSVSVSGSSVHGGGAGGPPSLFPYTSTLPRGGSPLASSQSTSNLSHAGSSLQHKRSYTALGAPGTAAGTPHRARVGSPLNPLAGVSAAAGGGFGEVMGGAERARKKQLVWDPERGLVSREAMEREREA